jgi:PST family polysaccharide transporter
VNQGYRQIVKSTGLVGIGQVLAILIHMVRVKALALLVGTAGMGIAGLYLSAVDVLCTVSGMGIAVSGVRYIATAADERQRATTIAAVRRLALLLGFLGSAVGIVLSPWLAKITFGAEFEPYHAVGMGVVSLAVLLRNASGGQVAVLQGLRKVGEMAAAKVLGALFAAIAGTLVVWILGIRGIAVYLVCVTGSTLLGSWLFARRHETVSTTGHRAALWPQSKKLIGTGSAVMGGALATALGAYLIRLSVQRSIDLSAVGIYQATWVLCSVYVGIVLEAMGADFYPRLSSVQGDDEASRRVINEQMEVGVLLAFPGVLFLVVVAPWALDLLYAADFRDGTTLMRWQLLGVALRAISWPLGYLVLSRAMNWTFLATQVVFNLAYLVAAWLGMERWGLEAVGAAFAGAYFVLLAIQWGIARRLIEFRATGVVGRTIGWSILLLVGVLVAFETAPTRWAYGLGATTLVLYAAWALQRLLRRMNLSLAEAWERVRGKLG